MPGGVALLRDERRRAARAHRELGARVGARRRHEAEVTTSAEDPYRGAASLRVGITAPYGWGAQLSGWPGAPTSPGAKRISFWARQGTGAVSAVTVRVKWFDETGALLDASVVPLDGLTTAWQQAVADVTAPPGTATAHVEAYGDSGARATASTWTTSWSPTPEPAEPLHDGPRIGQASRRTCSNPARRQREEHVGL